MDEEKKEKKYIPLDEAEINLFKAYGLGPYADSIKKLEEENKEMVQKINKLTGSSLSYRRHQGTRHWACTTRTMEPTCRFQNGLRTTTTSCTL